MPTNMLVYSDTDWITVELPTGYDPNWTSKDCMFYGVLYALALRKGFSQKKAKLISESAVFKRMYPDLVFSKEIEKDLLALESSETG